jgi:hypothetical protein
MADTEPCWWDGASNQMASAQHLDVAVDIAVSLVGKRG